MLSLLLACHADPKPASQGADPTSSGSHTPTLTTPTDTYTPPPPPPAEDLAWTLSPTMGSVVIASWDQVVAGPTHVEYSVDPDVWESSPSFDAALGPQSQVLVGIPFAAAADWRVVGDPLAPAVDGPPIQTGPLPPGLPSPRVVVSDPTAYLSEGRFLLTSLNATVGTWVGGHYWTVILDRQGRYVWATPTPNRHWTLFTQVAVTGDALLWDESTAWSDFDSGAGSRIHRTWLDEEIEVVPTPGLHHEFVQLPDGTFAWGSIYHDRTEALVEKAPGQLDETVIWTCADDWPGSGDCESNGLFYDAHTDTYLYSFYTNSTIVSVARKGDTEGPTSGGTLWWAGTMRDGYTFDPARSQYHWQHGISYTDAGTLLVSSVKNDSTWLLEYEIDAEARQLHYVWGSDAHTLARDNGAAWRLANGDTLHVVGTAGVVREVDPDGLDVWRISWDSHHNMGEGQWIEDLYALVKPR